MNKSYKVLALTRHSANVLFINNDPNIPNNQIIELTSELKFKFPFLGGAKGAINIPFLFQMNKKHIQKCLFMNKKRKNESLIAPLGGANVDWLVI
jgi:hypothetical protein